MKNLLLGIILGSTLTAGLGLAGTNLYNNHCQIQAPNGSQQQLDYFRQRQSWLDLAATPRMAEIDRIHGLNNPCGK